VLDTGPFVLLHANLNLKGDQIASLRRPAPHFRYIWMISPQQMQLLRISRIFSVLIRRYLCGWFRHVGALRIKHKSPFSRF
jgi:hypothetical protein